MLESLLPLLLGERDPRMLVEMAQLQLDTGRAALANDPELTEKATVLFKERLKRYPDTAAIETILEQYNFSKQFGRLAFSLACLPEHLRSQVLHDVFKSLCVWIGKAEASTWVEGTPGKVLTACRDRLKVPDTSIAVLQQVQDTLLETCPASQHDEVFAEYAEALKTYIAEVFATAQTQLDEMKANLKEVDETGVLDRIRGIVAQAQAGLHEAPELQEHTDKHRHAGKPAAICGHFKHPNKQYSDAPCIVIDWEANYEAPTAEEDDDLSELMSDYVVRSDLYSIPDDGNAVLVEITDGDYAGEDLIVHDSELTY